MPIWKQMPTALYLECYYLVFRFFVGLGNGTVETDFISWDPGDQNRPWGLLKYTMSQVHLATSGCSPVPFLLNCQGVSRSRAKAQGDLAQWSDLWCFITITQVLCCPVFISSKRHKFNPKECFLLHTQDGVYTSYSSTVGCVNCLVGKTGLQRRDTWLGG